MYIIFYVFPYLIRLTHINSVLRIIWYMPSKLQSKFSQVVSNVGISFSLEGQSQNKICYHKIMQAKFNALTIYDIRHICI